MALLSFYHSLFSPKLRCLSCYPAIGARVILCTWHSSGAYTEHIEHRFFIIIIAFFFCTSNFCRHCRCCCCCTSIEINLGDTNARRRRKCWDYLERQPCTNRHSIFTEALMCRSRVQTKQVHCKSHTVRKLRSKVSPLLHQIEFLDKTFHLQTEPCRMKQHFILVLYSGFFFVFFVWRSFSDLAVKCVSFVGFHLINLLLIWFHVAEMKLNFCSQTIKTGSFVN